MALLQKRSLQNANLANKHGIPQLQKRGQLWFSASRIQYCDVSSTVGPGHSGFTDWPNDYLTEWLTDSLSPLQWRLLPVTATAVRFNWWVSSRFTLSSQLCTKSQFTALREFTRRKEKKKNTPKSTPDQHKANTHFPQMCMRKQDRLADMTSNGNQKKERVMEWNNTSLRIWWFRSVLPQICTLKENE